MRDQAPTPAAGRNLASIAIGGFLLGVLLHFYVIFAILGDDESPTRTSLPAGASPVAGATSVPAQPTRLADRNNCDAIRGTDYRSESERQWFLANCP
jgi:hypothetical protein